MIRLHFTDNTCYYKENIHFRGDTMTISNINSVNLVTGKQVPGKSPAVKKEETPKDVFQNQQTGETSTGKKIWNFTKQAIKGTVKVGATAFGAWYLGSAGIILGSLAASPPGMILTGYTGMMAGAILTEKSEAYQQAGAGKKLAMLAGSIVGGFALGAITGPAVLALGGILGGGYVGKKAADAVIDGLSGAKPQNPNPA